ncbi:conserved hypothetical protein [Dinoroseobacter shibae DFL 12 = DSM 16493]|uniref:Ancillary SecYEG translocon subunit/Cell division coordinator CpoB TPR domain-containing protein n=1 Tax=Dinoroseobacter shibae (strain DSM 16493 / NCIMB 14021 / DFL 12) TaxID=398580 RepID=A8LHV9_DINSH|nr:MULTISPECIES: tetratricopeptide repeat protein [Dinoroseobacter]ABV92906.1 conserved hypothetical protein [Dinoroseobacter shibae DFL 12 = DSM 16493]MDD9716006.1 tetratricopeptide repeat protein [Dinoroseobacter sp. PD6]URF47842.1 tetratricopeptide repeat protein [Dinoroseobacter shibae]URF52151.1 tetratricopeptide repeat protein [Dinoroseobacter shibae]
MSNPDSFIEEVAEEVRRDRMSRLMRKYGWIGVLAVVLIVGGAAFNEYRKAQEIAAAQAFGDAVYDALEGSSEQTRLLALQEVNAPEVGAPLLGLITAAESTGDPAEAAEILQSVITDPETPPIYQDLARLRLVLLGDAALPATERRALLDMLILGSGPFRLLALEQRALLEVEAGETEAAIATLQEVIRAAGASLAQQQRAAQLVVALGGDVALDAS